jgi:hypothetical protein
MSSSLAELRQRSLAFRQALLAVAMLAAYALAAPAAGWLFGWWGLASAALAGAVCWIGAGLALGMAFLLRGPNLAMQAMLFALVFRTGLPLGFVMIVQAGGGSLTWAGLVYFLLVFYLVALGVEVLLSLPEPGPTSAHAPQGSVK